MDRVESIRALVQVLDGSGNMAGFIESLCGDVVGQENADHGDQNQERNGQSDVRLAIQAAFSKRTQYNECWRRFTLRRAFALTHNRQLRWRLPPRSHVSLCITAVAQE